MEVNIIKDIFALLGEYTIYYFRVKCIECGKTTLVISNTPYPSSTCDTCGTVDIPTCENFIRKEVLTNDN